MNTSKQQPGLIRGVFMAHFVLFLHVFLIAGIGLLILFFRGIILYMPWIFFGGAALLAGGSYLLYRRARREGRSLTEMLSQPMFKGRSVEVSFLGGLASLKVSSPEKKESLTTGLADPHHRLADPHSLQVHELTELVRLLDENLITLDEYNKAKKKLLGP